jgi:hypothetical protein
MSDEGLKALAAELRDRPPKGLEQLTDEQQHTLAQAIQGARHRQAAELDAAGQQALQHIPKLLRLPIRKFLG